MKEDMEFGCGCKVIANGFILERCPLHLAAKDLLEALKELLYVTEPLESEKLSTPFKKARLAIKKAERMPNDENIES